MTKHTGVKTFLENLEKAMSKWIYECWNAVMDYEKNPLSNIPDVQTRHMIMQVLAWMWCIAFGFIVSNLWAGVISMMAHIVLIGAIAITVATFETAKSNPQLFTRRKRVDGYNGRQNNGEHN